jgi:hypothetical protein
MDKILHLLPLIMNFFLSILFKKTPQLIMLQDISLFDISLRLVYSLLNNNTLLEALLGMDLILCEKTQRKLKNSLKKQFKSF